MSSELEKVTRVSEAISDMSQHQLRVESYDANMTIFGDGKATITAKSDKQAMGIFELLQDAGAITGGSIDGNKITIDAEKAKTVAENYSVQTKDVAAGR